mgnify:FL=1
MNARTLSLVFCKATLARPHLWALSRVVGNPIHIDIGIGGVAFAVSPKKCFQWDLTEWIEARRASGTLHSVITVPITDGDKATTAALNFAVGPMTYRGTVARVLGRPSMLDVDCVAAAMIVLKAGGVDPPQIFVTARSLYRWISSKHPPQTSPP